MNGEISTYLSFESKYFHLVGSDGLLNMIVWLYLLVGVISSVDCFRSDFVDIIQAETFIWLYIFWLLDREKVSFFYYLQLLLLSLTYTYPIFP